MFKKYLIEKISWMMFFVCICLLFLLIAYIDPAIPFTSILYMVFLSTLFFIIFLMTRYHKETAFYRDIKHWDDLGGIKELNRGTRPFEEIVYERLHQQYKSYQSKLKYYEAEVEMEKDELLSWIHEVKTPLTTMQLMMERMEETELKKQMKVEWLRIELLLDQQLHHKRIPFIENDLTMTKVALQPLIVKEIKMVQSWCMQKGIGFEMELTVSEVLTDAKWLGFVVRQLVTNAIKYSEASDITIRSYMNNEHTHLEIVDQGCGIDPKDLPRIFDKGFTSTSEKPNQAATGMGLYLIGKVMEPLKMQIDVQSIRHEGTTFTITFPKQNEFVHLLSM